MCGFLPSLRRFQDLCRTVNFPGPTWFLIKPSFFSLPGTKALDWAGHSSRHGHRGGVALGGTEPLSGHQLLHVEKGVNHTAYIMQLPGGAESQGWLHPPLHEGPWGLLPCHMCWGLQRAHQADSSWVEWPQPRTWARVTRRSGRADGDCRWPRGLGLHRGGPSTQSKSQTLAELAPGVPQAHTASPSLTLTPCSYCPLCLQAPCSCPQVGHPRQPLDTVRGDRLQFLL